MQEKEKQICISSPKAESERPNSVTKLTKTLSHHRRASVYDDVAVRCVCVCVCTRAVLADWRCTLNK